MTTIKEWSDRGVVLRSMALRLEDRAAGLQAEAVHLKAIAISCDEEAARLLNEACATDHI